MLERWGDIASRVGDITDRFCTALVCVDVGFIADGLLDELPKLSQLGAARVGGIDLNRARIRNALAAVLALAVSPAGFTVAEFTDKVKALAGQDERAYTTPQGAYDLRKLRAKSLIDKQSLSRRYQVPPESARTISGIVTSETTSLRPSSQAFGAPISVANPPSGPPSTWTTSRSASRCRPSSATSPSPPRPRHRQLSIQ